MLFIEEREIRRTMTTMIARFLLPSLCLVFLSITITEAFLVKVPTNFQHRLPSSYSMKRKQPTIMDAVPDQAKLQQVLDVAIDASKKAGEIILGNAGGAEVTKSKANSRDLLTLIDPLCEKVRESSRQSENVRMSRSFCLAPRSTFVAGFDYYLFTDDQRDGSSNLSRSRIFG